MTSGHYPRDSTFLMKKANDSICSSFNSTHEKKGKETTTDAKCMEWTSSSNGKSPDENLNYADRKKKSTSAKSVIRQMEKY